MPDMLTGDIGTDLRTVIAYESGMESGRREAYERALTIVLTSDTPQQAASRIRAEIAKEKP